MSHLDDLLRDLVVANRILANENVVNVYGHISVRHPGNAGHFLMSRSRAPELVERDDLVEFDAGGEPVSDRRQPYLERSSMRQSTKRSPTLCRLSMPMRRTHSPFGLIDSRSTRDLFRQLHRRQGSGVGHPQEIR